LSNFVLAKEFRHLCLFGLAIERLAGKTGLVSASAGPCTSPVLLTAKKGKVYTVFIGMERVVLLLNVKPGFREEYVKRHKEVWPAVLDEMKAAGVRSMNIFLAGNLSVVILEAEDYETSIGRLQKAPFCVRWEEFMAPIMEGPGGEVYSPSKAWPEGAQEVFCWKA